MPYLNQAGTSWPKPAPVRAAVAGALASDPTSWSERFAMEHGAVAAAFGVPDPARLVLAPACTSALAVAVADLPWEAGDRALASALEHHALHRPLTALAARGVELTTIPRAGSEPFALDALERELARGRVRLVAATAACNVTGELLPVDEIVALAHAHDALCLIDAAQVAGWLPLDVISLDVDLLAFAGHKALHGPWGVGGLYVAPRVAMVTPGASCTLAVDGASRSCAPMPGYCDVGSVDRIALAGLAAALRWLEEPAQADRLPRARLLAEHLAAGARNLRGVVLHGTGDPQRRLPVVALTVEGRTASEVAAALERRGIVASGGLQCAPLAHEALGTAPDGVLRLSLGAQNEAPDVDAALAALHDASS